MKSGFYVVRMPKPGLKLILESRCFDDKAHADNWCSFIQSEYPKHEVFVIEKVEPENDV